MRGKIRRTDIFVAGNPHHFGLVAFGRSDYPRTEFSTPILYLIALELGISLPKAYLMSTIEARSDLGDGSRVLEQWLTFVATSNIRPIVFGTLLE